MVGPVPGPQAVDAKSTLAWSASHPPQGRRALAQREPRSVSGDRGRSQRRCRDASVPRSRPASPRGNGPRLEPALSRDWQRRECSHSPRADARRLQRRPTKLAPVDLALDAFFRAKGQATPRFGVPAPAAPKPRVRTRAGPTSACARSRRRAAILPDPMRTGGAAEWVFPGCAVPALILNLGSRMVACRSLQALPHGGAHRLAWGKGNLATRALVQRVSGGLEHPRER